MLRHLRNGVLLGLAAAVVVLLLDLAGALHPLEAITWGWRATYFAKGPRATQPIALIALDQASLDWGRRENRLAWPWPREAYAPVLAFCRRAGVKAVAFDVLFTEPSLYGQADDAALAAALAEPPSSVGSLIAQREPGDEPPAAWPPAQLALHLAPGTDPLPAVLQVPAVTLPSAELAPAFTLLGDVAGAPDNDGVFRRAALLRGNGERLLPSLALAAWLAVEPQPLQLSDSTLRIGPHRVPLDVEGLALLRYRGPSGTFPTWSAAAIIQSELALQAGSAPTIDPAALRGAVVFFGLTAPGLYDLRPTPVDGIYPGMEIHATALDNLLAGDFLRPAPAATGPLAALLLALTTACAVLFCRSAGQALAVGVLLLPFPFVAGYVAYSQGLWLPVAVPAAATLLALLAGMGFNYATEGRKKREIRRAFNQYLHPTVIEQLVSHPERLRLGGEKRELTIFFSDLQGFTALSEDLDPEALITLLNDYLTAMTDIILDSGGTIDKYEGDAIIAFWNAPLDQPDHALRAVHSALACQRRLAELRPAFRARVGRDLYMRIGLNTGLAVVGNMGSQRRFDYTMLGDAVNLAARLEGVNKEFSTYTLISAATREQLGNTVPLREIGVVGVVGRREPVRIFEPLLDSMVSTAPFATALQLYYRGSFAEAEKAFAALATTDATAARYAARCSTLAQHPPDPWDGVWQLASK